MNQLFALLLSLACAVPASALEVTVYNSNLGLIKDGETVVTYTVKYSW
ncbi:MAG: hypothetical protein AAB268_07365 [Elusimicrobiota bacterium]